VRARIQAWQVVTVLAFAGAIASIVIPSVVIPWLWPSLATQVGRPNPVDLVASLPAANATVVYIDVDALRRSGILNLLAGSKAAEEADYQQFVNETQFDYARDLNAVAAAFKDGQVYFALYGRFHWKSLNEYVAHQGGSCHDNFCVLAGSQPKRRISFYPLESNVMAMAVAPDDFAAYQIKRQAGQLPIPPPNQPLWALVPAAALKNADALPDGAKPYLAALQNTDQILFSVGPSADHLQLDVHVTCKDAAAASALLGNLEGATKALRQWTGQSHQSANPADLTSLLVAGAFRRDDRHVYGQWPIPKAFVDAIAGGSF
jgi:hypothetical protein